MSHASRMKRPQMPDHYERDAPEHHERVGIGSLNSISPVPENSHFPKDGEASPNRRKGMVDQPSEWKTAHRMVSPENNGGSRADGADGQECLCRWMGVLEWRFNEREGFCGE